jgi:hypothetical protein
MGAPVETFDVVNRAKHYNTHPSGIEAIDIVRGLNFDMGCVVKYVMRRNGKEYERSLKSAEYYLRDQHRTRNAAVQDREVLTLLDKYATAEPQEVVRRFYVACRRYLASPTNVNFDSTLAYLLAISSAGV